MSSNFKRQEICSCLCRFRWVGGQSLRGLAVLLEVCTSVLLGFIGHARVCGVHEHAINIMSNDYELGEHRYVL